MDMKQSLQPETVRYNLQNIELCTGTLCCAVLLLPSVYAIIPVCWGFTYFIGKTPHWLEIFQWSFSAGPGLSILRCTAVEVHSEAFIGLHSAVSGATRATSENRLSFPEQNATKSSFFCCFCHWLTFVLTVTPTRFGTRFWRKMKSKREKFCLRRRLQQGPLTSRGTP